MLQHARLDEHRALFGIETDGKPVHGDVEGVRGDGRRVFVVRRQRVPVRDEKEAFIFFLKFQPVLKCAEIMAEMKAAGRPHAAQDPLAFCHSKRFPLDRKAEIKIADWTLKSNTVSGAISATIPTRLGGHDPEASRPCPYDVAPKISARPDSPTTSKALAAF